MPDLQPNRQFLRPMRIIGVGASAGGFDAICRTLSRLPSGNSDSVVVIQHLSAKHKTFSNLLLERRLGRPVVLIDDDMPLKPGVIYFNAPGREVELKGHRLRSLPVQPQPLNFPVDRLFSSLARDLGQQAVGVVLSGAGSDGTRGAQKIREQGGRVVVQDPKTCEFDGMPSSVIRSGHYTAVAEPEAIIPSLDGKASDGDEAGPDEPQDEHGTIAISLTEHDEIMAIIRRFQGLDFRQYRSSTIQRRIRRRVAANGLATCEEYLGLLRSSERELASLQGDLLVGVTRFFRDTDAFQYLETQVLPQLFARAEAEERGLRFWCSACSTGEEAYSLAMLVARLNQRRERPVEVKIFATDANRESLALAARGWFDKRIEEEVERGHLERFFDWHDGSYRAISALRRLLVFSPHDLTRDPPFSDIDLVSCRNMLIYLDEKTQAEVLRSFHFGMATRGILFLGKAESIGKLNELFTPVATPHRIFSRLAEREGSSGGGHMSHDIARRLRCSAAKEGASAVVFPRPRSDAGMGSSQVLEEILKGVCGSCIVINSTFELLHTFGEAGRMLQIPSGRSTSDIRRMVPHELAYALTYALSQCKEAQQCVEIPDVPLASGDKGTLLVRMVGTQAQSGRFLVSVRGEDGDIGTPETIVTPPMAELASREQREIRQLETELTDTRESLEATIEQLEVANEEMQSTNEELLSSNEELHASNEELQSVNEELHSLNREYQLKIDEVSEANNDISVLLNSSDIGTLFLDEELRVRRRSSNLCSFFPVLPRDVGRRLDELALGEAQDETLARIAAVVAGHGNDEFEIAVADRILLVKVFAHERRGEPQEESPRAGVVLFLLDVTAIRRSGHQRQQDAEEFNYVIAHDLRRPLRALREAVDDIEEAGGGRLAGFEGLQSGIAGLTEMLDTLLRYSRLRTRGGAFEVFFLSEAISAAAEDLTDGPAEGLDVRHEAGHLTIVGDREQIREALGYLLVNAYENAGEGVPRCDISVQQDDFRTTLLVRDFGRGIAPENREDAFRLFFTRSPEGGECRGVGLSLARRIVLRHGGWISFDELDGPGAQVRITLPNRGRPQL